MEYGSIFVSYSHLQPEWLDLLENILEPVRTRIPLLLWSDRDIVPSDNPNEVLKEKMSSCNAAVLLVTKEFLSSRYIREIELPALFDRLENYSDQKLEDSKQIQFPVFWMPIGYSIENELTKEQAETNSLLYGRIQPLFQPSQLGTINSPSDEYAKSYLGQIPSMLHRVYQGLPILSPNEENYLRYIELTDYINIPSARSEKLPKDLFKGRENELQDLTEHWQNTDTRIVQILGDGGLGKTRLVNVWLSRIVKDRLNKAANIIIGYSFYNLGKETNTIFEPTGFIEQVERAFKTDLSKYDDNKKGQKAAELVKKHAAIVIIDGLEPMMEQEPSQKREKQKYPHIRKGNINQPAIKTFLSELLIGDYHGICIITSRMEIGNIGGQSDYLTDIPLGVLDSKNSIELLREAGLKVGRLQNLQDIDSIEARYEDIAFRLGYHPQAIIWYLCVSIIHHNKEDIDPVETLRMESQEKDTDLKYFARKTVEWVDQNNYITEDERNFMKLIALSEVTLLESESKNIFNKMYQSNTDILEIIRKLKDKTLILVSFDGYGDALDTHPISKSYFLSQMNSSHRKSKYNILSKYFFDQFNKVRHGSVEDASRALSLAVRYRVRAGKLLSSVRNLARLYGGKKFSVKIGIKSLVQTQGRVGVVRELRTLEAFFEMPFSKTDKRFPIIFQIFLFGRAGLELMTMGRLESGGRALEAGTSLIDEYFKPIGLGNKLKVFLTIRINNLIARVSGTDFLLKLLAGIPVDLTLLQITKGRFSDARIIAYNIYSRVEKSPETFQRIRAIAFRGAVEHRHSKWKKAYDQFAQAEALQKEFKPEHPLLHSTPGYLYCDLLFDLKKYDEVRPHAEQTLDWRKDRVHKGTTHLTMGKLFHLADIEYGKAVASFKKAHREFRISKQNNLMPRLYLAWSEVELTKGNVKQSLNKAHQGLIFSRSGNMNFFTCELELQLLKIYNEICQNGDTKTAMLIPSLKQIKSELEKTKNLAMSMKMFEKLINDYVKIEKKLLPYLDIE